MTLLRVAIYAHKSKKNLKEVFPDSVQFGRAEFVDHLVKIKSNNNEMFIGDKDMELLWDWLGPPGNEKISGGTVIERLRIGEMITISKTALIDWNNYIWSFVEQIHWLY